jgi:hypothetical protein
MLGPYCLRLIRHSDGLLLLALHLQAIKPGLHLTSHRIHSFVV